MQELIIYQVNEVYNRDSVYLPAIIAYHLAAILLTTLSFNYMHVEERKGEGVAVLYTYTYMKY